MDKNKHLKRSIWLFGAILMISIILLGCEAVPPPASITLEPEKDTNPVCTWHTVTATVKDKDGNPAQGVEVRFTVTGANPTSGSSITDDDGKATFSFHGENVGTDGILANANGAPTAIAFKYWVDHEVDIPIQE